MDHEIAMSACWAEKGNRMALRIFTDAFDFVHSVSITNGHVIVCGIKQMQHIPIEHKIHTST